MVVGAKVCELTGDLLWFLCGNIDVFPKSIFYTVNNFRQLDTHLSDEHSIICLCPSFICQDVTHNSK